MDKGTSKEKMAGYANELIAAKKMIKKLQQQLDAQIKLNVSLKKRSSALDTENRKLKEENKKLNRIAIEEIIKNDAMPSEESDTDISDVEEESAVGMPQLFTECAREMVSRSPKATTSITTRSSSTSKRSKTTSVLKEPDIAFMVTKNNRNEYSCERCSFASSTIKPFNRHVRIHPGYKPYQCPLAGCTKRFNRNDNVKQHMESHQSPAKFSCKFPHCGSEYARRNSLEHHYRNCHGPKRIICPFDNCAKQFTTQHGLERHRAVHQIKLFKCRSENCNLSFGEAVDLRNHVLECHTSTALTVSVVTSPDDVLWKFPCRVEGCNMCFQSDSTLECHVRLVHMKKNFPCSLCPTKFATTDNYDSHFKEVHGKARNLGSSILSKDARSTTIVRNPVMHTL